MIWLALGFKKTAVEITEEGFKQRKVELFGEWKESASLDRYYTLAASSQWPLWGQ